MNDQNMHVKNAQNTKHSQEIVQNTNKLLDYTENANNSCQCAEPKEQIQTIDADLDGLFAMLPEGTRIIIRGNKVTFENLTPELLDVALSLNPRDEDLIRRRTNG